MAGRTKTAGPVRRALDRPGDKLQCLEPREDHLGNPVAMGDDKRASSTVLHRHTPLIGIIRIYGPRCIRNN
jgi:hypothetical protein